MANCKVYLYYQSITPVMSSNTPLIALLILSFSCYLLLKPTPLQQSTFISFDQFKREFNKTYSSPAEESYRKIIFSSNQNKIKNHNIDPQQTYKLGVTQFADLTQEEFVHTYLHPFSKPDPTKTSQMTSFGQNLEVQVTRSKNLQEHQNDLDWSARGNVSPVRNQGMCGSCWAFSAAGSVESSYSIFRGDNTSLSPQQLVDCSSSYGNNGCNGGRIDYALNYIKDHGLSTEKQYPYVGRLQSCKKDYGNYKISGFGSVSECTSLYMALHERPISVGVDASTWALYKQGILSICGHNINHGALLVGAADNFWKIKNSWGTSWGQNGYIRIGRGNTCGVCQTAFYPLL